MLNFNYDRIMKKILNFSLLALSFMLIASCDSGFDALNTSKTGAVTLDPALLLNNAIISSSPGGGNTGAPAGSTTGTSSLTYDIAIVQQIITSNSGVQVGGNFNQINIGNTPLTWQNYYQNVIKYTVDVISRTKTDATRSNLYQMARIIQANAFMVLTDTYGDIPYTDAGAGYFGGTFLPKYETQESIYPRIIQELTDATAALGADPVGKLETGEILYKGDIAKWKQFGYSLLLRAGMHIANANPSLTKTAVTTAVAGGVITANANNAVIVHDNNYQNGIGNTVNGTEAANFYLTDIFVNSLKSRNDPRLGAIAVRYPGATSGSGQTVATQDLNPANQFGMPVGSDDAAAQTAAVAAGLGSRYSYSQADRNRILKRASPMFIVTASQNQLLIADALQRGIIATAPLGNALTYFQNGIKSNMDQMVSYDPGSAVSAGARDTYAAARVIAFAGNELSEIGYEYWVASFLNGQEAWANFRRTGFPTAVKNNPNPFPGKLVPFVTRITYPPSELLVNGANVNAAISAMGGNNLDTKVWWNK